MPLLYEECQLIAKQFRSFVTLASCRLSPRIASPLADSSIIVGTVQIQGMAFGGMQAIKSVEVSIYGGVVGVQLASSALTLGKYAWPQLVLQANLPQETHVLS